MIDVFFSCALSYSIFWTVLDWPAEITGVFSFIIPAFSSAIFSMVLPRISIWSIEIEVITIRSGLITFVESNRPPSPVSMTATSTLCLLKWFSAMTVVVSKKVDSISLMVGPASAIKDIISWSSIGIPFTLIRSLKRIKWGDVYSPTFFPLARRMLSI